MQIAEPMTMFTDYLIFLQSLWLAKSLYFANNRQVTRSQNIWIVALVFIGFASLFGGTHHGLDLILDKNVNHALWKMTTYSIGMVSFLIFYGTMKSSCAKSWHKPLFAVALAKLIIYYYWMFSHDKFMYVIFDYAPSMLAVLFLQIYSLKKYKTGSEKYFIYGVLISFFGAGIQQAKIGLHTHFNHNDLYHIIQMIGIYMFYKGIPYLRDQK
ncbi:MAG: hypothetical protein HOO06_08055 [Bdellovibrionaceae bacterium]|jgi:hypothetical protein|nr:hypothetical protein [Pseudobdellovibrionaceae bacterium]